MPTLTIRFFDDTVIAGVLLATAMVVESKADLVLVEVDSGGLVLGGGHGSSTQGIIWESGPHGRPEADGCVIT